MSISAGQQSDPAIHTLIFFFIVFSSMEFSRQDAGVGSHSLLQKIFPTQGSNLGLLHCRQIVYHLSHQGSLTILEWVAYPLFRGSSWPRNWTRVSSIAGRFYTDGLFFFFNLTVACRILVPQSRMELVLPAVESQTLDHWPPCKSPGVASYEAFS